MELTALLKELERLRKWPEDWNSYRASLPDQHAIDHAGTVITLFYDRTGESWHAPNILLDPTCGDVVFEWWYGPRKLTLYISAYSTEYIQVWGTDPSAHITDGAITSHQEMISIWRWLHEREEESHGNKATE